MSWTMPKVLFAKSWTFSSFFSKFPYKSTAKSQWREVLTQNDERSMENQWDQWEINGNQRDVEINGINGIFIAVNGKERQLINNLAVQFSHCLRNRRKRSIQELCQHQWSSCKSWDIKVLVGRMTPVSKIIDFINEHFCLKKVVKRVNCFWKKGVMGVMGMVRVAKILII